jgi:hypothetical protein
MTVQTTAGATFGIVASSPATYDGVGFAALSYVNVGEIVSLGEHGATYALVTHSPLDSRRVKKFKGSVNDGSMALALGMDITDAGQVLLIAGADGVAVDTEHSVEITYQDGSIEYFTCMVMSYTRNPSTIDTIIGANVTVELNNQIIDA